MHLEIKAAAIFLVKVCDQKRCLSPAQMETLQDNLMDLMTDKYQGHWYPDMPERGQAYRCISIAPYQYVDALFVQACVCSGIEYKALSMLRDITVWVDPYEVSVRYAEDVDILTVATFRGEATEQTSDYSSDGLSSESISENSDEEMVADNYIKVATNLCSYDEDSSSARNSDTASLSTVSPDVILEIIETDSPQPTNERACDSEAVSTLNALHGGLLLEANDPEADDIVR